MATSTFTQPNPEGPTAMPATISSTTAGTRIAGTSPTSKGAARAMAATTSSPVNDGVSILGSLRQSSARCAATLPA